MENEQVRQFCRGWVYEPGAGVNTESLEWHSHPKFAGVFLKHLVTGGQNEGRFSAHLVRVQAGHEIGDHTHLGQWEIHEVIGGTGQCWLPGENLDYRAGVCAVIPADQLHRVVAGEQDLYILAKFVPALL